MGRFGSLDPSDGGDSSRLALNANWIRTDGDRQSALYGYAVRSRLQLFSNFSYATRGCDDPSMPLPAECNTATNLDQFEQVDQRTTLGLGGSQRWRTRWGERDLTLRVGADYRHDRIGEVGLHDTFQRNRIATTRSDAVRIHALGLWGQADLQWSERWRSQLGLRLDRRDVDVSSSLPINSGSANAHIASPKVSLTYLASPQLGSARQLGAGLSQQRCTRRGDPR